MNWPATRSTIFPNRVSPSIFPGRRLWVLEDIIGGILNFLDRILDRVMWVFIILGVVPWCMPLLPGVWRSRGWLFAASALVVCRVALNRVNVFLVGFQAPYARQSYFPSVGEMAITIGLISTLIFIYRICVRYLPVLSARRQEVLS